MCIRDSEAILEAQMLMLQSHNILNPANGAPITVPATSTQILQGITRAALQTSSFMSAASSLGMTEKMPKKEQAAKVRCV